MVGKGSDRFEDHQDNIEEAADAALDTDDTSTPFAKWEIVETIKEKLRMQDSKTREQLLTGYGETVDRRQFLKLLGFNAGGAVIASGTGYFMGKKVFSDTRPYTITGMQGSSCGREITEPETVEAGETLDGAYAHADNVTMEPKVAFMTVESNASLHNFGVEDKPEAECSPIIGVVGGGASVGNIYLGDGSDPTPDDDTASWCESRGANGHGITGIFVNKSVSGTVTFEACNIQGMQDNSIYASAPAGNAEIIIERCYSANSYVSGFRLAKGAIRNSVAFNDDKAFNSQPVWVWSPGPVEIEESQIAAGPYETAIVGDGSVSVNSGAVSGEVSGNVDVADSVGDDPNIELENVPRDAEEASCGEGGTVTGANAAASGSDGGSDMC